MTYNDVIIVLGKRLVKNRLTEEGKSRVRGLCELSSKTDLRSSIIVFCGGVLKGQSVSEARAMYESYQELCLQEFAVEPLSDPQVLLEEQSLSTVENICNAASHLVESGLFIRGDRVKVTLLSNDYHLRRLIEIQQLMDEQGLLRVLKQRCLEAGLELSISYSLEEHVAIPYPYTCLQSQLFLLMDVLTTYRVYLEGVVESAFSAPNAKVRVVPYQMALGALKRMREIMTTTNQFPLVVELMPILLRVIEKTSGENSDELRSYLALFDTNVTLLNRYLDPEMLSTEKWW